MFKNNKVQTTKVSAANVLKISTHIAQPLHIYNPMCRPLLSGDWKRREGITPTNDCVEIKEHSQVQVVTK